MSPPRRKRLTRVEQRERNREALLDAAAEVFAARGFRVATLDDVADAAGLTKGAIYSHFSSKHDLFAAAIERRYRERLEPFRALMEQPGERPALAGEAALDFIRSISVGGDWALLFLEAWAEMVRNPEFGQRLLEVTDQVREALVELVRGQFAVSPKLSISPEHLAEMLLAMAHGFGIQHRLDPHHAPDQVFVDMARIFVTGLLATGDSPA
jgi:AcrR family transcriptional regulator